MTNSKKVEFLGDIMKECISFNDSYDEMVSMLEAGDMFDFEYRERVHIGEGTYKVKTQLLKEFNTFKELIIGVLDYARLYDSEDEKKKKFDKVKEVKEFLNSLTYDNFINNRLENGTKLSKKLNKMGINQTVLDWYSSIEKIEGDAYITISAMPHVVAGMTNYNDGSWSSCQKTYHGGDRYNQRLIGSVYDTSLYVAFLHENLEDVKSIDNISDSFMARVIMKEVNYEGFNILVPTKLYGKNENTQTLERGLELIQELNKRVFGKEVSGRLSESEVITNDFDGGYYTSYTDYVTSYVTFSDDVEIDCPLCEGDGEIELDFENPITEEYDYRDVSCPMCDGSGSYYVYIEYEEDVEEKIEFESRVTAYNEEYDIDEYHNVVRIRLNTKLLNKVLGLTCEAHNH
jgi:hypothetical protein